MRLSATGKMKQEFDGYVENYASQHKDSIRFSGEEPEYFSLYKIKALARMAEGWDMTMPRILDFGSGLGNSVPGFRKYFPRVSVTQSDVSSESLTRAKEIYGGQEAQLLIENNRIPEEDNIFDLAFTACVFHHIPQEERIG